jgi:hypothetical protein
MSLQLNINSDAVVAFTNKLEKMKRSALPSAIRGALNKTAFHVKTDTMQKYADKSFKKRAPNFFKANSSVERATGFDIKTMKATVGFIDDKLKNKSTNYAVKDLEQQEYGGEINKKDFIAQKKARTGNKSLGVTKKQYRIADIRNAINSNDVNAKSKKQKFVRAAFKAKSVFGNAAFVIGNKQRNGRFTLSLIKEISKDKNGKLKISRTPLYTYKKGNKEKVKSKKFFQRASLESNMKMTKHFISEAEFQFKKYNV